jgi:iron complex outermembrane receptor protein
MGVRVLAVSLLFCAAAGIPLRAQQDAGAATLTGTVLDQSGKAIQGATVTVKNEATGLTRTATTDSDGRFSVNELPGGAYTVET